MGDFSKMMDLEQAISYADDLVKVLKDKRDINNLAQCLESSKTLRSSCDVDFVQVQRSIRGSFIAYPCLFSVNKISFEFRSIRNCAKWSYFLEEISKFELWRRLSCFKNLKLSIMSKTFLTCLCFFFGSNMFFPHWNGSFFFYCLWNCEECF